MTTCARCGKRIHRTTWTDNGWKHYGPGWTPEDRDHDARPRY